MCLLFLYANPDARSESEIKLILINVRDEFYSRPTQVAKFWPHSPDIIGGIDLQNGRTGGTWLAMNSQNGKIGILLNILQPTADLDLSRGGRGFIVNDYVLGDESPDDYLNMLKNSAADFNGFLTVCLQVKPDKDGNNHRADLTTKPKRGNSTESDVESSSDGSVSPSDEDEVSKDVDENLDKKQNDTIGSWYTNFLPNEDPRQISNFQIHGFGNSLNPYEPWPKVNYGKDKFKKLLESHLTPSGKLVKSKDNLIKDLFDLLSDSTKLPLDDNMIKQGLGRPRTFIESLSTLNVHIPSVGYGSRSWTVIIIDGKGNVDLHERSLIGQEFQVFMGDEILTAYQGEGVGEGINDTHMGDEINLGEGNRVGERNRLVDENRKGERSPSLGEGIKMGEVIKVAQCGSGERGGANLDLDDDLKKQQQPMREECSSKSVKCKWVQVHHKFTI